MHNENLQKRRVHYLRIVVTTDCPMRCSFCHMEGDPNEVKGRTGLSYGDLTRLLRMAVRVGIQKFKFLGGEPLMRRDLVEIVGFLRKESPSADISMITAGVGRETDIDTLFDHGLSRANLSIHGWGLPAFLENGRSLVQHQQRERVLERLLAHGRPLKLNYVYTGEQVEEDLTVFLDWAASKPVTVNLLDDLGNQDFSSTLLLGVLERLRGRWVMQREEPDPYSLPTQHLFWSDGLRVEIKDQKLGEIAPWSACGSCQKRKMCREGIHALRLTHKGVLQPCMDRPDLGIALLPLLEKSEEDALAVWEKFVYMSS